MKIIDMHAHVWMAWKELSKKKLLDTIEKYNVSEMYVSSLNGFFPNEELIEEMNKEIYLFHKAHPQIIKGYAYIGPEHKSSVDVVKKAIEEQEMVGIKIWISEYCDNEVINPVAEKIIEYNVPLLIHTFRKTGALAAKENTSVNVRNLALRYPELKIIMAHVDGNCYHGVNNIIDLENVWVDISGTTNKTNEVEYVVENLGEDRVLFGTDLSEVSFSVPYGKVMEAQIEDKIKRKIFYDNTKKFFDRNFKVGR